MFSHTYHNKRRTSRCWGWNKTIIFRRHHRIFILSVIFLRLLLHIPFVAVSTAAHHHGLTILLSVAPVAVQHVLHTNLLSSLPSRPITAWLTLTALRLRRGTSSSCQSFPISATNAALSSLIHFVKHSHVDISDDLLASFDDASWLQRELCYLPPLRFNVRRLYFCSEPSCQLYASVVSLQRRLSVIKRHDGAYLTGEASMPSISLPPDEEAKSPGGEKEDTQPNYLTLTSG